MGKIECIQQDGAFLNMTEEIELLRASYKHKRREIRGRMADFAAIRREGDDTRLFEELVYCIFTAGASARMGEVSVGRVRRLLKRGTHEELMEALVGAHRFPRARSGYIVTTRNWLRQDCGLRLREKLDSFGRDHLARRDYFARTPGVKGIGYKEASHYLRNIGYRGYAILDKHILRTLHEHGIVDEPKPPATRQRYLAIEERMKQFATDISIDFDELDLLLWSNKTGVILK
ncbi:MAG: hypothetical protein EBU88_07425 [Acidobacteria bacterium]|nr:hypothetical protein [Acidobacteriota bacterium]